MANKQPKEKISRQEKAELKKQEKLEKKKEAQAKKEIEKQRNQRQQQEIKEQTSSVSWTYAGEADLTIGEKKISNVAKVILLLLLAGLITGGVFAYLNREFIIDYISKPEIALTTNKVTLEVGSDFDFKNYVVNKEYPERYELIYPTNDEVDTKKLGEYTVEYKLKTLANENTATLIVDVVDTTPPEIKLTDNILQFTREKDTENFNPKKYIKSITDNYDKKKDIKVEYTETFDWTKDEVIVTYTATDLSNNISSTDLTIIVNDPPKEPEIVYVEKEVTPTPTPTPEPQQQSSGDNSGGNSGGGYSGGTTYTPTPAPTPAPTPVPTQAPQPVQSQPYINGVHDFQVRVGDMNSFVSQVQSGISGSGYISVDYSSVNLSSPGTYTVYYNSSDGVSKSCTVTVYE